MSEALSIKSALTLFKRLQPESESARLDAEVLLAYCLGRDRTYLYAWPEAVLSEQQKQMYTHCLARREQGEPVAHIVTEKEFWSLSFLVDGSTLIPRPDTEILVETALKLLPNGANVIDLGTGTGAIALSIAHERPDCRVVASDVSSDALVLAERNVQRHRLKNVTLVHSHWLDAIQGKFDMVISNPPYISENDEHLNQGDLRFEPRSALVAKNDGLADIVHIAESAVPYLLPGALLLMEHGWRQGAAVRDILKGFGYCDVRTLRDYSGVERAVLGARPV